MTLIVSAGVISEIAQESTRAAASEAFRPYDVVGVSAVPSGSRPWSVTWAPAPPEASPDAQAAGTRVFKYLESPDVNDCLILMIETDPLAQAAVLAYAKEKSSERAVQSAAAVRSVWTKYGVDAAIREVATTGEPGAAVERMLAACEGLKKPK